MYTGHKFTVFSENTTTRTSFFAFQLLRLMMQTHFRYDITKLLTGKETRLFLNFLCLYFLTCTTISNLPPSFFT